MDKTYACRHPQCKRTFHGEGRRMDHEWYMHGRIGGELESLTPAIVTAAVREVEDAANSENEVLVAASELRHLRKLMLSSGNEAVRSAGELLLPRLTLLLEGKARPYKDSREELADLAAKGRAMIEELQTEGVDVDEEGDG